LADHFSIRHSNLDCTSKIARFYLCTWSK